MASVNKAIIVGRLGKDPQLRSTTSGKSVCSFSVATSEKWKSQDGESQEKTEWHNIVVWGRSADACGQYLNKGSLVYIEGKLQTRKWQDKEGNDKYTTEIVSERVQFLDSVKKKEPDQMDQFDDPDSIPF